MTSPTHRSVKNRPLSPLSTHQHKQFTSAFFHPSDEEDKEENPQRFYEDDENMDDLLDNPIQTPKIPPKQQSKDFVKPDPSPLPICPKIPDLVAREADLVARATKSHTDQNRATKLGDSCDQIRSHVRPDERSWDSM